MREKGERSSGPPFRCRWSLRPAYGSFRLLGVRQYSIAVIFLSRPSGGTGRRAGLKIPSRQRGDGSTPSSGIPRMLKGPRANWRGPLLVARCRWAPRPRVRPRPLGASDRLDAPACVLRTPVVSRRTRGRELNCRSLAMAGRSAVTNARTQCGSNCRPAPVISSRIACVRLSGARYGRRLVIASKASAIATILAAKGISSPRSPSGNPPPSNRSWCQRTIASTVT